MGGKKNRVTEYFSRIGLISNLARGSNYFLSSVFLEAEDFLSIVSAAVLPKT